MPPVLLSSPTSLDHDPGPHPERPARMRAIAQALEAREWLGWERRDSVPAPRDALLAVHPPAHLALIEGISAAGGGAIDGDTILSSGSWTAALHGAGGAVGVVDAILGSSVRAAASIHRPPGHHCESARAMGFCLLSNMAIAARHARDRWGVERVLVVDWDVHHGNGTEEVFAADPGVLFCSTHQAPLYPGTGRATDVGVGEGAGFTVNLPVPGGAGDAELVSLVAHVVVPLARAYRPGLILVSAGFDAHADDPLAGCEVTDAGFGAMATAIRALADELGVGVGVVLEGGYDLGALARGVVVTLEAVGAPATPAMPGLAVHPLAEQALARLGGLAG